MRFIVEKAPFAKALAHVHRVVERRNTYPILANVLLSANPDGYVTLRATDLDIEITEPVAAEVGEPGQTTVPASLLSDIVRKFPDGAQVSFELGEGGSSAAIKAGRSRFSLATLPPDQFPDLKSGQFSHEFKMPAAELAKLIAKTSFAISTEETRYYLNGIYFHCVMVDNVGYLRGVATDGHRLSRYQVPMPDGAAGMPGVIIPRKTVGELAKLLDGAHGNVGVEISETKTRWTIGEVVLLSKSIEGDFPDYNRVTPALTNTIATVDAVNLKQAIDRVSIVSTDRGGKAVKFMFTTGRLELEVSNPDHGTSHEDMPVDWGGDAFDIGFNARYCLDSINVLDGKQVKLSLNDPGSPTCIFSDDDPDTLLVLMPMRV